MGMEQKAPHIFSIIAALEDDLRERLASEDASPYLGHYDIDARKQAVIRPIMGGLITSNDNLRGFFSKWPHLMINLIARQTLEHLGEDTGLELYPWLSKLFNVSDIPNDKRDSLHRCFRYACQQLALPVIPQSDMDGSFRVREYLLQAGVPLMHLANLAQCFTKTERQLGLPNEDDSAECARWSLAASECLHPTHSRLRFLLENDITGYYPRVYSILRRGGTLPEGLFTQNFGASLSQIGAAPNVSGASFLASPKLVFRDEDLFIEAPASQTGWSVDLGGKGIEIGASLSVQDILVPHPWPASVHLIGNKEAITLPIWIAGPASVLIFESETGRFVATAKFGEDQQVSLRPGTYTLFSRQLILVNGAESEQVTTKLHISSLVMAARSQQAESAASGPLRIVPTSHYSIELRGQFKQDARRQRLFASGGLAISIAVGDNQSAVGQLDLLLSETDGAAPIRIPLSAENLSAEQLSIDNWLGGEPRVCRLTVALVRRGESRSLAKVAAFVWVGATRFEGGLLQGRTPTNLDHMSVIAASVNSDRVVFHFAEGTAEARLAFLDPVKPQRLLADFSFPLNVLRIEVERRDPATAQPVVTAAPLGSTLNLANHGEKLLTIYSDDPDAVLALGGNRRKGLFKDNPRRQISFTALLDGLSTGEDTIRLFKGKAFEIEVLLCRLLRPSSPKRFEFKRVPGLEIDLGLENFVDQVRLRGVELISGRFWEAALRPNIPNPWVLMGWPTQVLLSQLAKDRPDYLLSFQTKQAENGIWFFQADVKLQNEIQFCRLVNARGDIFTIPLAIKDEHLVTNEEAITAFASSASDRFGILTRCHELLLECHESESWARMKWLLPIWEGLGQSVNAEIFNNSDTMGTALDLLEMTPSEESSETWVPLVHIWQALTRIWSLPGSCYERLRSSPNQSLKMISNLSHFSSYSMIKQVFAQAPMLDPQLATFFDTFTSATRCQPIDLVDLQFSSWALYVGGSANTENNSLLSPRHHAMAAKALILKYGQISAGEANQFRLGRLNHLLKRSISARKSLMAKTGPNFVTHQTGDVPALELPNIDGRDAVLESMPLLLSALALAARLEHLKPGVMEAFVSDLSTANGGDDPRPAIGLLLQLGPELFAFYLLFWDLLSKAA